MYEEINISVEQASDAKVLIISVAARMAGMHPQTLRQYDRLGLVQPGRAGGGGRRYSQRDVGLLREVQKLSQEEGVNLAGIKRIIGARAARRRPAAAGAGAGAAAGRGARADRRAGEPVRAAGPGAPGAAVDRAGGLAAAPLVGQVAPELTDRTCRGGGGGGPGHPRSTRRTRRPRAGSSGPGSCAPRSPSARRRSPRPARRTSCSRRLRWLVAFCRTPSAA